MNRLSSSAAGTRWRLRNPHPHGGTHRWSDADETARQRSSPSKANSDTLQGAWRAASAMTLVVVTRLQEPSTRPRAGGNGSRKQAISRPVVASTPSASAASWHVDPTGQNGDHDLCLRDRGSGEMSTQFAEAAGPLSGEVEAWWAGELPLALSHSSPSLTTSS